MIFENVSHCLKLCGTHPGVNYFNGKIIVTNIDACTHKSDFHIFEMSTRKVILKPQVCARGIKKLSSFSDDNPENNCFSRVVLVRGLRAFISGSALNHLSVKSIRDRDIWMLAKWKTTNTLVIIRERKLYIKIFSFIMAA